MKRVAKAFTLFIASSTYLSLLFLTATTVSISLVLRSPTVPKQWLEDSGVYSSAVDEVSKPATLQQQQENSLVQITSEDIQATAKQSFPPESLQVDAEGAIDGFYGWFKGDTTGPVFSIDFSGRQATFAANITNKLADKINELPECENTGRFSIQAFDPFKADCRPKGVDITEELASFEKEIATSTDILPQASYTGDDLKINDKNGEPQRIASSLSWVPRAYTGLVWGPWGILALTVCSGLAMIFLSTSRRKGIRRFANGLLLTGVVLIVSGLFLRPAYEKLNGLSTRSIGAQASFTQNIIDPIFREMNSTFARYSVIFGIAYTIPALVAYSALLITRTKKDDSKAHDEPLSSDIPEHSVPPTPQTQNHSPDAPAAQSPAPAQAIEQAVTGLASDQPPQQPAPAVKPRPQQDGGRTYERRPPMIQG